jgi:hypothetical protein
MIDKTSMSLFEVFYLLVTTAGFVAVSTQLWIQRQQSRLLLKTLEASASTSVAQRQLSVDKVFVERPHLCEYFLQRKSPASDSAGEVSAMAMLLLNYFDTYFLQKDEIQQLYPVDAWEAYMALYFRNSPFLRQFLNKNTDLYSRRLCEFMQKAAPDPSSPH